MDEKRPTLTLKHDASPRPPRPVNAAKTVTPKGAKHAWADAALREAFAAAAEQDKAPA